MVPSPFESNNEGEAVGSKPIGECVTANFHLNMKIMSSN